MGDTMTPVGATGHRDEHFGSVARSVSTRRIESLLEQSVTGRLVVSLTDLASAAQSSTASAARMAVLGLNPVDHRVSVDVRTVDERTAFEIVWAPATAIVDMMIDWDLSEIELALDELCGWLEVEPAVAYRALERLAVMRGVDVIVERGDKVVAQVSLDLSACPLTAVGCPAA
ncbi:hypothetical protein OH799_06590 [Nocardia sp. NBC_00881]|uniref:hypothetical protein n=1 Tax=Nocardia sp. NBC_00881 TaxID=2975995 RepID=UPI00386EE14C|nr:hypothetical protein OH799_06590 [Nocardia sp. NBC_00881]